SRASSSPRPSPSPAPSAGPPTSSSRSATTVSSAPRPTTSAQKTGRSIRSLCSARRGYSAPGKSRARQRASKWWGAARSACGDGGRGGMGSAQGAAKPRPSTGRAPRVDWAPRLFLQAGAERAEADRARVGDDAEALLTELAERGVALVGGDAARPVPVGGEEAFPV